MRIPPYYRLPSFQRFFAGVVIGGAISWVIFLFMFGVLQEKQTQLIQKHSDDIQKYKEEKLYWQEEFTKLNEKNQDSLTIQEIKVKITNREKFKIEQLSIHEAEEQIRKDLRSLLAKDIKSVYQNKDLINRTIENKILKINDKRYKLKVKDAFFFTTIELNLELSYSE